MTGEGLFRRRNLPHWDVEGKPVFVTGCLEGSISSAGLQKINTCREQLELRPKPENLTKSEWEHRKQKLLFAFVDNLLDYESPTRHLTDDRLAKIVCDAFLHFADVRYALVAFAVMPSHHHWLFLPKPEWVQQTESKQSIKPVKRTPREIISHSIQSYTSNQCNKLLQVSGKFWQDETFDHWVRDDEELIRIIEYIEQNPVKAGRVAVPHEWRWSSAFVRHHLNIPRGNPIPNYAGSVWS